MSIPLGAFTNYVDKVGGWYMLEMSTVCRFSLTTVKEFLHKCQPGVGRSIMGDVVKERPTLKNCIPVDKFIIANLLYSKMH